MKKLRKFATAFFLILLILGIANAIANRILTVSHYEITSDEICEDFRVVLLADLHNSEYGAGNSRLLQKVKEAEPDLIIIAGDMNLSSDPDNHVVLELCQKLVQIVPVCYSLGNHELAVKESGTLLEDLADIGVHVLDNAWEEMQIGADSVLVGGLTIYPSLDEDADAFLQDFQRQDGLKLLLCHYPEYYQWSMAEWDVDVIFAGHAHGGQIRIPLLGGLYAPDQGYFPAYVDGVHSSAANTLVISRGLGSSGRVPRVNNPPELVVADITR